MTFNNPGFTNLEETYHFLYNSPASPPSGTAISLYCHPAYVRPDISVSYGIESSNAQLDRLTLAQSEAAELLQSEEGTPNWLVSGQRYLEKSAAEFASTTPSVEASSATQQGLAEALNLVASVLARHAVADRDFNRPAQATEGEESA